MKQVINDMVLINEDALGLKLEARKRAFSTVANFFRTTEDLKYIPAFMKHFHLRINLVEFECDEAIVKYDDHHNLICNDVNNLKQGIEKMRKDVKHSGMSNRAYKEKSSKLLLTCMKKLQTAQQNIEAIFQQIHLARQAVGDILYLSKRKVEASKNQSMLYCYPSIQDIEVLFRLKRWEDNVKVILAAMEGMSLGEKKICSDDQARPCYVEIAQYLRGVVDQFTSFSSHMCDAIKANLLNCICLGQTNPRFLVSVVEAFELIGEYENKESCEWEEKKKISFYEDTLKMLSETFSHAIQEKFSSFMYQAVDENMSRVDATLGAATNGLVDLIVFNGEVNPCFPEKYCLKELYLKHYEDCVIPQIKGLCYRNFSTLKVKDILRLISWMSHYNKQKEVINPQNPNNHSLDESLKLLMLEYKTRMRMQTKEWLNNILSREKNIFSSSTGLLLTDDPEHIIISLLSQLSLAKENLPHQYMIELNTICIEELSEMNKCVRCKVKKNWEKMEIEVLISIINDSSLMHDKCESLFIAEEENDDHFKIQVDRICAEYIETSIHATKSLVELLYFDLKDHVFSRVLSKDWENGEPVLEVAVATLEDYFRDLQVWLQPYFFSKCKKMCFHELVHKYVEMCFFPRRMRFLNSILCSQRIKRDQTFLRDTLQGSFHSLKETKEINEKLDILESLSNLMASSNPIDSHKDVSAILRCLPTEYAISAILQFIGLRDDISQDELNNWRDLARDVFQVQDYSFARTQNEVRFVLPYGQKLNSAFQENKLEKQSSVPVRVSSIKKEINHLSVHTMISTPLSRNAKSERKTKESKKGFSDFIKGWTRVSCSERKRENYISKFYHRKEGSLSHVKVKLMY